MKDFINKIGWIFLGLIVAAFAIFSLFLGLGSVAEIYAKIFNMI